MIKNFESKEIAEELVGDYSKVVINTVLLANEFQFIRFNKSALTEGGIYLLFKDFVSDNKSLWFGYEVIDEATFKINFTKPLWLHLTIKNNESYPVLTHFSKRYLADIAGFNNYKSLELPNFDGTEDNYDLALKCVYGVSRNIIDLHSKARISSYIKCLASVCTFDYDFLKSEVYTDDSILAESNELCLRSRYMPLKLTTNEGDKFEAVSVFIDSLKINPIVFGVWYCLPLNENKLFADKGFFVSASVKKQLLNVNTVPSNDLNFEIFEYNFLEDYIQGEKIKLQTIVAQWLKDSIGNLNHKNIDIDGEIVKIFNKLDKQKDLFLESIFQNMSFVNVDKVDVSQYLTVNIDIKQNHKSASNDLVHSVVDTKSIKQAVNFKDENADSLVDIETLSKQLAAFKTLTIDEEFPYEYAYSLDNDRVILNANGCNFIISVDVSTIKDNPNKAYNELLSLRVDPFTVLQLFSSLGISFKTYTYGDAIELISAAEDKDLQNYIDFENYFSLVRLELLKRKKNNLVR